MISAEMQDLWQHLAKDGWSSGHFGGGLLYPMPGDPRFDEDASFLDLPLFPGGMTDTVVRVRDDVWEMPLSWFRHMETRPRHELRHKFRLVTPGVDLGLAQAATLAVKRCMYLEIFRSRRPVSVSTLRHRRMTYMAFAKHACAVGKRLEDIDYGDIADVVSALGPNLRKSLAPIYELLRWWKASSSDHYRMFQPPPTIDAVRERPGGHGGLDVNRVRGDSEEEEGRRYQPFSDAFVAAAGEFCLSVLDELRPAVISCMREIMAVFEADRETSVRDVIAGRRPWPLGMRVATKKDLRAAANLCQTAAIFVLSLVLGPRWSEVSSLAIDAVQQRTVGGRSMHFLEGSTFKLSDSTTGESRDWPLNHRVAAYLEAQREYVELVEEPGFRFLWRSHEKLWGGGEPLRQFDLTLKKFSRKHGFEHLLGEDPCHHHRFRKTTARLIVIALHGGPVVLRRLFGHEHLAMTLRYILANQSIVDELRAIAEEEQRRAAAAYIKERDRVRGGGAEPFRKAMARIADSFDVFVPDGKRDQATVTTAEILEVASDGPDGLALKQIVPGLVACFKPRDEAGMCCKAGELPNVARCDAGCGWHLAMPEFIEQARINVVDALQHLASAPPGSLIWRHYVRVVQQKVADFPELAAEHADDPAYLRSMEDAYADAR